MQASTCGLAHIPTRPARLLVEAALLSIFKLTILNTVDVFVLVKFVFQIVHDVCLF